MKISNCYLQLVLQVLLVLQVQWVLQVLKVQQDKLVQLDQKEKKENQTYRLELGVSED